MGNRKILIRHDNMKFVKVEFLAFTNLRQDMMLINSSEMKIPELSFNVVFSNNLCAKESLA